MARRTVAEFIGKSSGFDKVSKDVDKVSKASDKLGRQQTRLGQASASAGRQFSAQSAGLGGLVAAYAGAAATIFAITAAFDALNRAARAEQTITGVNALANAIGESGPRIIAGLQEITKGQLSIVQTAELANLALSSGFSADQINELAEISLKASRALGRDLTDSFNRLVRGVTKLEPELLDELGIFTRIEPAAEKFAASIGKTVSQLSNFEKRQAFANAVAEEGAQKFRDIDTSANTSSESLEKLSATISNIGISVGGFIAKVIAPLAEALTGNLIASVGAFGILAKTVFGTTLREAQGSLQNFSSNIDDLGDRITDKLAGGTARLAKANDALGTSLGDVNLRVRSVSAANEAEFKTLIQLGRAKELSTSQTKRLRDIVEQEIKTLKVQQAALKNSNLSEKALEVQTNRLNNKFAELNKTLAATNTRLAATPKVAAGAAAAFKVVSTAVAVGTSKLLGFLNGVTLFITVLSTLSTVGAIILDAFGFLDPLLARIDKLIRKVRVLLDITKEDKAQTQTAEVVTGLIPETLDISLGGNRFRGQADNLAENFRKRVLEAIKSGQAGDRDAFIAAVIPGNIENQTNRQAKQFVEAFLPAINEAFDNIKFFGPNTLQGIAEFADATGRTLKTANAQLDRAADGGLTFQKAADLGLQAITRTTAKFIDTSDITDPELLAQAKIQNQLALDRLQSQEVSANLQEALNSGQATAEQIEKRRGAIAAKIRNLKQDESGINDQLINDLQRQLEITDVEAQTQLAILNTRNQIRKTFSAQIAAASQLSKFFNLEISSSETSVKLATNSNEQRQAQIIGLQQILELTKEAQNASEEELANSGTLRQQLQLARDAQAALTGNFIKSVEAARALLQTLEKINEKQEQQKEKFEAQLILEQQKTREQEIQLSLANERARIARDLREVDVAKKVLKATQDRAKALREIFGEGALSSAELSANFNESDIRQLELKFKRDDLDALRDFTKTQSDLLRKTADLQKEDIQAQIRAQEALIGTPKQIQTVLGTVLGTPGQIRESIAAQRAITLADIDARADTAKREIDALEERNSLVQKEILGFKGHVEGMARVLGADITARKKLQEGDAFATLTARRARDLTGSGNNALINQITDIAGVDFLSQVGRDQALTEDQARRISTILESANITPQITSELKTLSEGLGTFDFQTTKDAIDAAARAEKNLANFRLDSQQSKRLEDAERTLADLRAKEAEIAELLGVDLMELETALIVAQGGVRNLAAESKILDDRINAAGLEIRDTIENRFVSGFQQLNDALIEGTLTFNNLKEGFRDFASALIKDIQRIFMTKTLAEPAAEFLAKGFSSGFTDLFGTNAGPSMEGLVPPEAAFGAGDFTGGMLGGPVKMASGGMLRDRVPALLEPGEFVIRKPAAKAIGGPALGAMNATGKMPGDVSINIQNEGSPKDAEAQQPRFDGEKFVIDVVMRDLSNNGPIRKSLRAGG